MSSCAHRDGSPCASCRIKAKVAERKYEPRPSYWEDLSTSETMELIEAAEADARRERDVEWAQADCLEHDRITKERGKAPPKCMKDAKLWKKGGKR